jgi:predicted MPP superfamily phosphohydrolase
MSIKQTKIISIQWLRYCESTFIRWHQFSWFLQNALIHGFLISWFQTRQATVAHANNDLHYEMKVFTVMGNNSTNVNQTNNYYEIIIKPEVLIFMDFIFWNSSEDVDFFPFVLITMLYCYLILNDCFPIETNWCKKSDVD